MEEIYHPQSLKLLTREQLAEMEKEGKISKLQSGKVLHIIAAMAGG